MTEEIQNAPRRRGRPAKVAIDPAEFENNAALQQTIQPQRNRSEQRTSTRRRKEGRDDPFYIDPSLVPDGMTYEWKRESVYGQEDEDNMVNVQEYGGWTNVPASRPGHGRLGQKKYRDGGRIGKGGLVLMERPKELTEEAREEDYTQATGQVQTQMQRLSLTPKGTMERQRAKINRSYEAYEEPTE